MPLQLKSTTLGVEHTLACTSFQTTLFSEMSTVQTKEMQQHFPIKAQQPAVTFNVVFPSERDFEDFQKFVRRHQQAALHSWPNPQITLWWPERNIQNWTGIIKDFRAGGQRFNPMPRAQLSVDLIDSVYSTRTELASMAQTIWAVAGYGSPSGVLTQPLQIVEELLDRIGVGGGAGSFLRGGR
ncbi:hypothetical protein SEA_PHRAPPUCCINO_81 [Mycobacterium phage Phrappuccino]|uniref:Uncharacterized protein n=1 Tax=Mycobacterium phage Phrappuccino TaxID=2591223 RepID=A0A514DDR5_9CAUD|nr:hypothetical protein KHQ87_gp081 [Mycobacterium phage Phrappuccino]QDH91756.1 hypothetical protein SEA_PHRAPPUCCINO_81 [Mycobacterium phage Phrappuccino]QIQ63198.1 hypothetical protein SEA_SETTECANDELA_81 [Mycobacterium phage Settecandela]